jgi:hypothetical protein
VRLPSAFVRTVYCSIVVASIAMKNWFAAIVTWPVSNVGMANAWGLVSTRQRAWLRSKLKTSARGTVGWPVVGSGISLRLMPPPDAVL